MKNCLLICFLLISLNGALAQTTLFVDSILDNRILKVPAYEVPDTDAENIILRMAYGQSTFLDTTGISLLRDAQLLSVELLFSDFPAAANLKTLNKNRLLGLCQLVPGIDKLPGVNWTIVRQTDGFDKASSEQLVHGFVINYRPTPLPADIEKEIALIETSTPPPPPPPDPPAPKEKVNHWAIMHRSDRYTSSIYNDQPVKRMAEQRERLIPFKKGNDTIVAITTREAEDKNLLPSGKHFKVTDKDSIFLLLPGTRRQYNYEGIVDKKGIPVYKKPVDSTVHKMLQRMPLSGGALVVADVTYSMAPYIAQLVDWLGEQDKKTVIDYFVCFNDGDSRPDNQKQINHTGGIYSEKYVNSRHASELIQKTMRKGNGGGDMQENVCEALLQAIRNYPKSKDLILIADSWAPIRDTGLIGSISRPVQIIVCGKRLGVHPDYIMLALATGGSLRFKKEDITDFRPLREGKAMVINQCTYYYVNGRIEQRVR